MSEKIYACFLRLFPSRFRQAYGEEAMLLLRDRIRDEKGLFLTLRLWLDLLIDLAVSLPRQLYHDCQVSRGVQTSQCDDRTPWFRAEEAGPPRPVALFVGSMLSLATLGVIPVLINHFGNSRLRYAPSLGPVSPTLACSPVFTRSVLPTTLDSYDKIKSSELPLVATCEFRFGTERQSILQQKPVRVLSAFALLTQPTSQLSPHDASSAPADDARLDNAERRRVIESIITSLMEHYVYPDISYRIEEALLARENAGDYNSITDGPGFAAALTKQLRDVSHDLHLEVVFSPRPLPDRATGPSPESFARYREAMRENNCTFEKVQILPNNIAYLKLDSFPDPSICGSTAKSAMASLNTAQAVIFDLRDNRSGYPGMVMLIAAYLFDHPEYMYNPRENTTEQSWTRSPVPGNKLADKPVYVLTSARTFSGAEHFSYNLKMLKRAILVGETTGGATDVGAFHRLDDHFGMGIRESQAINPYSEPDWAVVGVRPDVKVKPATALKVAEKMAEQRLRMTRASAAR